jgi:hypothetical protein
VNGAIAVEEVWIEDSTSKMPYAELEAFAVSPNEKAAASAAMMNEPRLRLVMPIR